MSGTDGVPPIVSVRDGLIADTGPPISRLAVQLLPTLFDPSKADRLRAYASLLDAFPEDMTVSVLADQAQAERVGEWLSRLRLCCRYETIGVAGGLDSSIAWIRDAFFCRCEGGARRYLKTGTVSGDAQAFWLGAADGTPVETVPVSLDGGDCLVGADFWLVGANAVARTAVMAGRSGDIAMAAERLRAIDGRRMVMAGFRLSEADGGSDTAAAGTNRRSRPLMQNWAHIDLVVSVTGTRDGEGREILLVASTTLAPAPYSVAAATQDSRLDALAHHLARNGFAVIRNPAPFAMSPRRILAYNNVIAELDPKRVWVPQFGGPDGEFRDTDAANVRIWRDLGFAVVPVPGWRAFTPSDGSIRCATNVLTRRSPADSVEPPPPSRADDRPRTTLGGRGFPPSHA